MDFFTSNTFIIYIRHFYSSAILIQSYFIDYNVSITILIFLRYYIQLYIQLMEENYFFK